MNEPDDVVVLGTGAAGLVAALSLTSWPNTVSGWPSQHRDPRQRALPHGVVEIAGDCEALAYRVLLRLRQGARILAAGRAEVDAQLARHGAGLHPEAVLLRHGVAEVTPSPQG